MMDAPVDRPEPPEELPRPPPEPPGRERAVRLTLLTEAGAATAYVAAAGLLQRVEAVGSRPIGGIPVAELARSPEGKARLLGLAFRAVGELRADPTAAALLALWLAVHASGAEGDDLRRRLWGLLATEGRAAVLIRRGPAGPVVALASRIGPGR